MIGPVQRQLQHGITDSAFIDLICQSGANLEKIACPLMLNQIGTTINKSTYSVKVYFQNDIDH